jgi:hypothetical protein
MLKIHLSRWNQLFAALNPPDLLRLSQPLIRSKLSQPAKADKTSQAELWVVGSVGGQVKKQRRLPHLKFHRHRRRQRTLPGARIDNQSRREGCCRCVGNRHSMAA